MPNGISWPIPLTQVSTTKSQEFLDCWILKYLSIPIPDSRALFAKILINGSTNLWAFLGHVLIPLAYTAYPTDWNDQVNKSAAVEAQQSKLPKSVSYWHCHQSRETNFQQRRISLRSLHSVSRARSTPCPSTRSLSGRICSSIQARILGLTSVSAFRSLLNTIPFCFRHTTWLAKISANGVGEEALQNLLRRRRRRWCRQTTRKTYHLIWLQKSIIFSPSLALANLTLTIIRVCSKPDLPPR